MTLDRPDAATAVVDALARARRWSPFLGGLIDRSAGLADELAQGRFDVSPRIDPGVAPHRALRLARRRIALTVAVADLAGAFDLTAVTGALTGFADAALDVAIAAAMAERYPGEPVRGFVAIALGKQGSFELNYSSDIDPILLFDPDTIPRRAREEPGEAAVRIARRVVELLGARDADGHVLRVDLRLRPSPEVSPIAIPVDQAIAYYEGQALAWERAAFIRARIAAGDRALGHRFLAAIEPFVWRRALDYGALGEVRSITTRIRDHYREGQVFGPGFDLKRGRGGIREIEFFAQVHQLIHGGRDPSLRTPATRDALAALAAAGRIEAADAAVLTDAYVRLRTAEHRLQMVDDRQTHSLPEGEALDRVARLHGVAEGGALLDWLRAPVAAVGRIYDRLGEGAPAALPDDPVLLDAALAALGFADIDAARARIEAWRGGGYPALRSQAARAALEAVLPTLIPALAEAPAPGAALLRLDALLERLPSAINLFRLLEARPTLGRLLMAVLSYAEPLADALARRPSLLDGLIDASALEPVGTVATLVAAMTGGADYGERLDRVRRVAGEARFALGVQIVAAAADPLSVAAGYARVAEAAVEAIAAATIDEFATAHGRVPGSELVVLALGRLGGGALTHASDLDLVYLFTGDFAQGSDGAKPLGASLYYNRLAQRLTGALSVATAAGPLYPVDTRLRPSGAKGPLAISLDSFQRYQREEAWTWEHMALTRARPVVGSPAARRAVAAVVASVLGGERPPRDIARDARAMRAEMVTHKPPLGMLDAKLAPGGLVDLEFAVHTVQLRHRAGLDPDLGAAIAVLVEAGLLPPTLVEAQAFLTRLLVVLRLVAPDAAEPAPATQALIARAMGVADWPAVLAGFERVRHDVAEASAGVGSE